MVPMKPGPQTGDIIFSERPVEMLINPMNDSPNSIPCVCSFCNNDVIDVMINDIEICCSTHEENRFIKHRYQSVSSQCSKLPVGVQFRCTNTIVINESPNSVRKMKCYRFHNMYSIYIFLDFIQTLIHTLLIYILKIKDIRIQKRFM